MEVEDTGKRVTSLVPAYGRERLRRDVLRKNDAIHFSRSELLHLRRCKEGGDHLEYICVAPRRVIEPGRVDQNDTTTVQLEGTRKLYGVCVRSQASANA